MRALIADVFAERYLADLRAMGLDVHYDAAATAADLGSKAKDANILVARRNFNAHFPNGPQSRL